MRGILGSYVNHPGSAHRVKVRQAAFGHRKILVVSTPPVGHGYPGILRCGLSAELTHRLGRPNEVDLANGVTSPLSLNFARYRTEEVLISGAVADEI